MESARVLVAEDDPDMRSLIVRALQLDGHRVYEAQSGDELLATMRSMFIETWPEDGVDLVVTDVRMPGLSGLEAARMLRESRWNAPIILMTALTSPALLAEAEGLHVKVLAKPFTLEDLLAAARDALGSPCA